MGRRPAKPPIARAGRSFSSAALSSAAASRRASAAASVVIFCPSWIALTASALPAFSVMAIWIADCGHWLQQEEPEQVNAALIEFLGDVC